MTLSDFLVGCGFLVIWVGAPATASVLLRRRLLPDWVGAPALLVDVLSTLALLLTVAQLLGTVGGLTRPGLTAGSLLVGSAGLLLSLRLARPAPLVRPLPPEPRWSRVLGVLAVAAVLGVWWSLAAGTLRIGLYDTDSLVYHWPYAASFAQSGWTTQIHLGAPGGGSSWHAANAELLGGISILAFHRDWLLPLLNFGWFALAVLAAWVAGRRVGVGGLMVAATCVLMTVPIIARSQGATGFTDAASLALVLSACALFLAALQDEAGLRALIWSGAAMGMAASTKETTLATGAVMGAAVLFLCWRSFLLWAAPAAGLGSFWYLRNLVREDNPIPTSHLGPFRSIAGPFIEKYGYSVADHLTDLHIIRHIFIPQLVWAWGVLWPVLVLAALVAAALSMRKQTPAPLRALAVIGVIGLMAYLVTPTTAFGFKDLPVLFPENTRYALPSMVVLVVLLVRLVGARLWFGAAVFVTLLGTIASRGPFSTLLPHNGVAAVRDAAVATAVLLGAWWLRSTRWQALGAVAAVLAALPLLFVVGRDYERDRYAASAGDSSQVFAWARSVHHAHIGVDGMSEEYPLTGNDVSNRVTYIGVRDAGRVFIEAPSCPLWRQAVNGLALDYVVIGPHLNGADVPAAARWVDPLAMATVLTAGHYDVYRVTGRLDEQTCPTGE